MCPIPTTPTIVHCQQAIGAEGETFIYTYRCPDGWHSEVGSTKALTFIWTFIASIAALEAQLNSESSALCVATNRKRSHLV
jgi:hypothetical protein